MISGDMICSLDNYCRFLLKLGIPAVITNYEGEVLYVNKEFESLSGYLLKDIKNKKIGKKNNLLYSGYHNDNFYKNMWDTIKEGKSFSGQIKNNNKSGKAYWQDAKITPINFTISNNSPEKGFMAIISDITTTRHASLTLSALLETIGQEQLILIFDKNKALIEVVGTAEDETQQLFLTQLGTHIEQLELYPPSVWLNLSEACTEINLNNDKKFTKHYSVNYNGAEVDLEVVCRRFNTDKFIILIKDITTSRDFLKIKMGITELEEQVNRLLQSKSSNDKK
jgi:PAS domain S-box-containing protein